MKKLDLSSYQIKKEENPRPWITPWMDYAASVCKEFNITGDYKKMIFKYAKSNINYLRGKVANAKEKFGTEKLEGKGNYLISLFRSQKPWDK